MLKTLVRSNHIVVDVALIVVDTLVVTVGFDDFARQQILERVVHLDPWYIY